MKFHVKIIISPLNYEISLQKRNFKPKFNEYNQCSESGSFFRIRIRSPDV
jgi:hypothetical protein